MAGTKTEKKFKKGISAFKRKGKCSDDADLKGTVRWAYGVLHDMHGEYSRHLGGCYVFAVATEVMRFLYKLGWNKNWAGGGVPTGNPFDSAGDDVPWSGFVSVAKHATEFRTNVEERRKELGGSALSLSAGVLENFVSRIKLSCLKIKI